MSWFDKVPKVELHLHLEGAIPYDALWELICKYAQDFASCGGINIQVGKNLDIEKDICHSCAKLIAEEVLDTF